MSDGNYNRNLLPYHHYRSGLSAGRIQMKKIALECFERWYDKKFPDATEITKKSDMKTFQDQIDSHSL